ncbi:hypothetical protein GCM10027429_20100 [Marivirga atlantica]|jgi:YD repeat-containing protein|uniref:RHS repeat protein n=1 Tax=Marivirga atlantica TaxID=1548457 RepID=A0A937AFN6_9BACT|nr:RHS repeat domain-containing protein [Marivirga atlantica]MBL0765629.1 RHS repeat protein [Marivirga atlantica]
MRKLLFTLIIMPLIIKVNGQGINQEDLLPTNIIQASPNAASLGEYGQYPVSKFTGIPNISIPLYTIKDGDIEVPISISYHAGGYKPGEDASLVGYGWALNAGGAITRSVNGEPDENEYFKNMAQLREWEEQGYLWTIGQVNCPENEDSHAQICVPEAVSDARYNFLLRNPDTQADLFLYNFPGGIGKFQFNENKEILKFPYTDIKIEADMTVSDALNGGIIKYFDIKNEYGLNYHFFTPEETSVYNLTSDEVITEPYVSAWYLNRIYSKISNNYVDFAYSSINGLNKYPLESESYSHYYSIANYETNSSWSTTATRVHLQERLLQRITWGKGYVEFVHSGRNDIAGGEKLDEILIYNNQDQLIKSYRFTYGYYTGSGNLRLDKVEEVDPSGKLNEPYIFTYNADTPDNNTKAIDHYGYYNGVNNNTTTIPYVYNFWRIKTVYADREIKPDYPMVGMLTSIIYPTKGKTEFEYENNTSFGAIYEKKENMVISENCDENGGVYVDESGNTVQGLICQSDNEIEFTIPDPITVNNGFTIEISGRTILGTQISHGDMYVLLIEKNQENGSEEILKRFDIHNGNLYKYRSTKNDFDILPGRTYILNTITNIEGSTLIAKFSYNQHFRKNYLAPGIRIKEIKNYDMAVNSFPIQTKTYSYDIYGENGISSGIFNHRKPKYHYEYDHQPEIGYFNVSENWPRNTNGQFAAPLVHYKQVEESQIGNGSVRDYFSFVPQVLEEFSNTSPDRASQSSDYWKVGQLDKQIIFKQSGDLLKKVKNEYSYIKLDSNRSFVYQKWFESSDPDTHIINWAFNYHLSGFERLNSTRTVSYVGQDSLVSQQNYFYENDNELLLPIAQETIDTKGNKKRLETQYLNDRAEHVIAPILNQKSYYNGSFQQELNQTLTDYKPTRKLLTNANGETIQDVEIRYQNGLNISQLSDKTSIPKSYTWGYNETLPIIEKTGAIISVNTINNSSTILPEGYETVDELLTSMENIANDTNAQNDWKVFNDNLRSNYNGFIKTYTYKSLVGITSFTDENGLTTFYEYDGFGRLIRVKDHHNNVLKSMTYSIKK